MLEDALGRLISGALWGVGAGIVMTVARDGGEGLRDATKGAMKGVLSLTDRVQEATAEMRENLEDLAAEVRVEQQQSSSSAPSPTEMR